MSDSGNSLVQRFTHRQNKKTPSDSEGGHQHFDLARLSISQNEMGSDEKMRTDEYVGDRNSLLSLQPWIFRKDFNQVDTETCGGSNSSNIFDDGINFLEPPTSPKNFRFPDTSRRNQNRSSLRNCIRSKHGPRYSATKPVESVENCLIPQLYYGNNFQTEDFVFSSADASTSSRPFCVTDGSRIISKSSCDPPLHGCSADGLKRDGVTLEKFCPELRKSKRRNKSMQLEEELRNSDSRGSCNQFSLEGPCDKLILICMGISIGVFSTLMRNKKEVEQLNELLKNSENLVRDLQEELDMKDSLTVNELVSNTHENDCVIDNLSDLQCKVNSCHHESPTLNFTMIDRRHSHTDVKNSECMDKIEAELEVELEKLQLNMSASSLEGKLSSLHDEFYLHDGELRVDMLEKKSKENEEEDSGGASSTGNHNLNYAVSPKELRLRLHEVNQSRLEDHIKELEAKLDHAQKQFQVTEEAEEEEEEETERAYSFRSSSIASSSSSQPTPTVVVEKVEDVTTQPLCLDLCDDALDAYEGAYDEFIRISGVDGNPNSGIEQQSSNDGEFFELKTRESYPDFGHCSRDDSIWKVANNDENDLNLVVFDDDDDDGGDDDDDDDGKVLIQQIVDRMRKSSSVALNAQRMLFALDGHD